MEMGCIRAIVKSENEYQEIGDAILRSITGDVGMLIRRLVYINQLVNEYMKLECSPRRCSRMWISILNVTVEIPRLDIVDIESCACTFFRYQRCFEGEGTVKPSATKNTRH